MHFELGHLSGPHRGEANRYRQRRVKIGTALDATVRFPRGKPVARQHAIILFSKPECAFHLTALEGRVFVNGREVREVILEDNDSIEFGLDGPKVRFRILAGSTCKPVRQMLHDARQIRAERGVMAWIHALRRDLLWHSGWQLRSAMALVVIGVAFGAAYLGGVLGTKRTTARQESLRHAEEADWSAEIDKLRSQLQAQLEEFRHEQAGHASREELDKLRSDLARRARVVDRMVARNEALRRVIDVYSHGVCLIHGIFTLTEPLSEESATDETTEPLQIEYFGSGFLAAASGQVITNRHVAEPWADNPTVSQLLDQGFVPSFVHLTASFPGKPPVPVDPATIRLSTEGVDVAIMQAQIENVPVSPLFEGDVRDLRGGRIVVLGYPTGLNGVLARAEPDVVAEVLTRATNTQTLVGELAARGMIVPVITQGALNEVRERRLVYDAETTFGGSGGPVFSSDGAVIGVNFAVTRGFGGSNFGVPISFARRLLSSDRATGAPETRGDEGD